MKIIDKTGVIGLECAQMGTGTKATCVMLSPRFYESVAQAAAMRGLVFSQFMRLAARDLTEKTFSERGLTVPDLSDWHMKPGGDFSEARAAKGGNYRKRASLADKIDEAKTKARKRRNVKGKRDVA